MTAPAARCGPLAIVLVSLAAVVGSLWVRDWRTGVVTLGVQLLLAPLAVDDVRTAGRRLVPGLLAAASVGFSSWLLGGQDALTGATAALRILTLVLPGALLAAYLDPSALGDALAQRVHLPGRPVVAAVGALQRLETLDEEWHQIDRARRARGLGPGRSPVARVRHVAALTFGLLVNALRRAARTAVAMDARGFASARLRTWAEPSTWTGADSVLLGVGVLLVAVPVVTSALVRG